jgi:hypothetical protein
MRGSSELLDPHLHPSRAFGLLHELELARPP